MGGRCPRCVTGLCGEWHTGAESPGRGCLCGFHVRQPSAPASGRTHARGKHAPRPPRPPTFSLTDPLPCLRRGTRTLVRAHLVSPSEACFAFMQQRVIQNVIADETSTDPNARIASSRTGSRWAGGETEAHPEGTPCLPNTLGAVPQPGLPPVSPHPPLTLPYWVGTEALVPLTPKRTCLCHLRCELRCADAPPSHLRSRSLRQPAAPFLGL